MDDAKLVRMLELPAGLVAPVRLTHAEVSADAIAREHLDEDVRGINASLELIRHTRGGAWPDAPVTAEGSFVDLVWHERESRDEKAFTDVLRDADARPRPFFSNVVLPAIDTSS